MTNRCAVFLDLKCCVCCMAGRAERANTTTSGRKAFIGTHCRIIRLRFGLDSWVVPNLRGSWFAAKPSRSRTQRHAPRTGVWRLTSTGRTTFRKSELKTDLFCPSNEGLRQEDTASKSISNWPSTGSRTVCCLIFHLVSAPCLFPHQLAMQLALHELAPSTFRVQFQVHTLQLDKVGVFKFWKGRKFIKIPSTERIATLGTAGNSVLL